MEIIIGLVIGAVILFIGIVLGVSIERDKKQPNVFNQYITSPEGDLNSAEVYRQTKKLIDGTDGKVS